MNMNSTSPSWAMTVRYGRTSAGNSSLRQVARQQPQHARAEHDPAQDLADDGGLAQPHEQPAHEPGDDDDDRDVEEDERQYVLGHAAPSRLFPTGAG